MVLTQDGEVFYASETISEFLGVSQVITAWTMFLRKFVQRHSAHHANSHSAKMCLQNTLFNMQFLVLYNDMDL